MRCIACASHEAKGLEKVLPLLRILRSHNKKLWNPGQVLHIDEYGKGGHHRAPPGLVFFNPTKPNKFHYEYLLLVDKDHMWCVTFMLPHANVP